MFELDPGYATQNSLLRRLPPAERSALQSRLHRVSLPKGEILHSFGSSMENVFFPESGAIMTTVNSAGREVDVLLTGREGMVGGSLLLSDLPFHHQSSVKIEGTGWRLGAADFREVCDRMPNLRTVSAQYLHGVFGGALRSIGCNAVHSLEARYASWLKLLAHRTGRNSIDLKQSEMARLLGAHRSRVTGTASALQSSGIIRYARGHIHILREDKLIEIACDCRQFRSEIEPSPAAQQVCCADAMAE
jgi:CRP-like cAMP-binding protein